LTNADNSTIFIDVIGQVGDSETKILVISYLAKAEGHSIAMPIQEEVTTTKFPAVVVEAADFHSFGSCSLKSGVFRRPRFLQLLDIEFRRSIVGHG
jgi:hypothetical protein